MSEMSLYQQIHQIENIIQYLNLIKDDLKKLNSIMSDKVTYLRQNGLRTETADRIQQGYLGNINDRMNFLFKQMENDDNFLNDLKKDLLNAANC